MQKLIQSNSLEETAKFGKTFAESLKLGNIIGFIGVFGAGKTYLIKSICKSLGIDSNDVTSPSFTLINDYKGKKRVIHMDMYRLQSDEEFELLDLDFYFDLDAIVLIEWADHVKHLLPSHTQYIEIKILDSNSRQINLIEKGGL